MNTAVNSSTIAITGQLKYARLLAYVILIDLLTIPYLQALIIPFSLPLLLAGFYLLNVGIKRDNYLTLFTIISVAVVISTAISLALPDNAEYGVANLKRAIQFLSSFFYFFYFRWVAARTPLRITPIISLFMLWYLALTLTFVADPLAVNEFTRNIYGRLVTAEENVLEHLRFNYIFTDPNTAIYFFLIAISALLMNSKNVISFLLLVTVSSVAVLAAQSRGGAIAFVFMVTATIYGSHHTIMSRAFLKKIYLLLGIFLMSFLAYIYFDSLAEDSIVFQYATHRLFGGEEAMYGTGESTRLKTWAEASSNFIPLPFGVGYTLQLGGAPFAPHSDVWRLLYSYGFLALIPTLFFFFSRIRSLTPLIIPALTAFLINTLIDEQKLLALFLSLLAISIGSSERQAVTTTALWRKRGK